MTPHDAKCIVNSLLSLYATYQQALDADSVPCMTCLVFTWTIFSCHRRSSPNFHLPDLEVSHSSVLGLPYSWQLPFFFWFPVFFHHYYKISERNNLKEEGFICLSFRDFSPSSQVRCGGKSLRAKASCFLAYQNTKGNTGTRGRSKRQRPPLVSYLHHQGPTSQKLHDLPTKHNCLGTKHSDT